MIYENQIIYKNCAVMMVIEKKSNVLKIFFSLSILLFNILLLRANEPDSAYIFAYGDENGGGLYFAWSIDRDHWHTIGDKHPFLKSDYGRWGSQKRMYDPFLFRAPDGQWHAVWSLNNTDGAVAHALSSDLLYWKPQSYPVVMPHGNCLRPEISYNSQKKEFCILWHSDKADQGVFHSFTGDFKHYSPAVKNDQYKSDGKNVSTGRIDVLIAGKKQSGTLHHVAWDVIDGLIQAQRTAAYKQMLNAERVEIDRGQFNEPVTISISPDIQKKKSISDLLIGIFYEDINYAADGGLYAELGQNRGFECSITGKRRTHAVEPRPDLFQQYGGETDRRLLYTETVRTPFRK